VTATTEHSGQRWQVSVGNARTGKPHLTMTVTPV
jgi:hypothetical protein